eukprot:2814871-Rhodomonas_salina.3
MVGGPCEESELLGHRGSGGDRRAPRILTVAPPARRDHSLQVDSELGSRAAVCGSATLWLSSRCSGPALLHSLRLPASQPEAVPLRLEVDPALEVPCQCVLWRCASCVSRHGQDFLTE